MKGFVLDKNAKENVSESPPSSESPVKLYCCYGVITVLTVAVIALSVALSARKTEQILIKNNTYGACPRDWIGFGNKCFYFSRYSLNWTMAQEFCVAHEAQLARFDNEEELNFVRKYKGKFDSYIGLYRESSNHTWKWIDNTEYNILVPIGGKEDYAYVHGRGISTSRIYTERAWICSKLIICSLR